MKNIHNRSSTQAIAKSSLYLAPTERLSSASTNNVKFADSVRTNLEIIHFITKIQSELIEETSAERGKELLQKAKLILRPTDYNEVVTERAHEKRCGWLACPHTSSEKLSSPKGKYRLSMSKHTVYEVNDVNMFCSEECAIESRKYELSLSSDPIIFRNEFMTTRPSVNSTTISEEPSDSAPEKPIRRKKKETSQLQTQLAKNPSAIASISNLTDLEKLKEIPVKSNVIEERIHTKKPETPVASADMSEILMPEPYTLKYTTVLSPFAQLVGIVTHLTTEETVAYLSRPNVPADWLQPSVESVSRSRHNTFNTFLFQQFPLIELGLPVIKRLQNQIGELCCTFLMNQSISSIPQEVWRVLLVLIAYVLCVRSHRIDSGEDICKWPSEDDEELNGVKRILNACRLDLSQLYILSEPMVGSSECLLNRRGETELIQPVSALSLENTPITILNLPSDLLTAILSHLSSNDLPSVSQSCRYFYQLSQQLAGILLEREIASRSIRTLKEMHSNAGYIEGIELGREEAVQVGFNDGFRNSLNTAFDHTYENGQLLAKALFLAKRCKQVDTTTIELIESSNKQNSHFVQILPILAKKSIPTPLGRDRPTRSPRHPRSQLVSIEIEDN